MKKTAGISKAKTSLPWCLSVVGYSGSGKTRLLEKMIHLFRGRGYTVGVIKHTDKPLEEERSGKDTDHFRKAGADGVILVGRDGLIYRGKIGRSFEMGVQRMVRTFFPDHHLVFTEGFKKGELPKLAVLTPGQEKALLEETRGEIIATFGETEPMGDYPHFKVDEVERMVAWLEDRFLKSLTFPKTRVFLDETALPLNPFVQELLSRGILGLLSSLKGFGDPKEIEVHLRTDKTDIKKMKRLRVALLCGGLSNEREISLKSGEEVKKALNPARYEVRTYDLKEGLSPLVADAPEIDVALILLHGRFGEDGTVQGLLELLKIPYQGSGVLGSALAMNKSMAKTLYRLEGLPVAKDRTVRQGEIPNWEEIMETLGTPVVIKPNQEGSSIGVRFAHNINELKTFVAQGFALDRELVLEEYIKGREITGAVLGNDDPVALPLVEIIPSAAYEFFDYEAKYKEQATREICPAPLPEEVAARAQEFALRAHKILKLKGYSRTDMIVRDEEIFVLETNTIPGMTRTSLFPLAARVAGLEFGALLDRLIELALEEKRNDQGCPPF